MNNKIFIAVSVLLVGIMSVIFGFDAPAEVPDSVVMSDTPATSAPEKAPSKEEILASVEESLTMWENGEASAQMVIRQFEELLTHEDEEISAAARKGIERITVETDSGRLFDDAEMQYSSGDYIGAIRSILNISPSYSGWDECSQLLISCKQQVNALVSAPETIEDYESSIALLDEYLELVDDEVMHNKRNDFSNTLTMLKDVEEIADKTLTFFSESKYAEAFACLSEGVAKYPDNEDLAALYDASKQQYIDAVTKKVHEWCEEKQYDKALALVDDAMIACECDEFVQLREYVREEQSFIYRFKKGFRRKFDWLF